jgi:hypothetical protein
MVRYTSRKVFIKPTIFLHLCFSLQDDEWCSDKMEQGACLLSLSLQPVIAIEFQNNSTVLGERGMPMKMQNDPYIFRG